MFKDIIEEKSPFKCLGINSMQDYKKKTMFFLKRKFKYLKRHIVFLDRKT